MEMGFCYHRLKFFPGCGHQGVLQGFSAAGYAWAECLVCSRELPWAQVREYNEKLAALAREEAAKQALAEDGPLKERTENTLKLMAQHEPALD